MPFVLKKYSDLFHFDHNKYKKLPHQIGYKKYKQKQQIKHQLMLQKSAEPLLDDEEKEEKDEKEEKTEQ